MQSKISSKWSLFTVSIVGIVFSTMIIFSTPTTSSQTPQNLNGGTSTESVRSITIRLKIPKINVDAVVESVGLTPAGAMGVPKDLANVAWFNLGPHPGDNGSAVIAGHYGLKNGIPAAFGDLHKLVKGDKLYVEDGKGATTTFVVREVRTYGQNEDASGVFTSSDGKAHLNLITCEGVWDNIKKSYSNRLVVFSDIES